MRHIMRTSDVNCQRPPSTATPGVPHRYPEPGPITPIFSRMDTSIRIRVFTDGLKICAQATSRARGNVVYSPPGRSVTGIADEGQDLVGQILAWARRYGYPVTVDPTLKVSSDRFRALLRD
jgi:hypothetical protein